jgi:hypothetical protein
MDPDSPPGGLDQGQEARKYTSRKDRENRRLVREIPARTGDSIARQRPVKTIGESRLPAPQAGQVPSAGQPICTESGPGDRLAPRPARRP